MKNMIFRCIALCSMVLNIILFFDCAASNSTNVQPKFIVVLKDCSLSTPVVEDSLDNEFISSIIMKLDALDEIVVLAITSQSYAKPQVIVRGEIPQAQGPLKANVLAAREKLIQEWQERSASVGRKSHKSDIIGALSYAELLIQETEKEKWLIILSDLRNSAAPLNIEYVPQIPVEKTLAGLGKGFIPDLSDVNIVLLGVHTDGVSPAYYKSLRLFWTRLVEMAHGRLVACRTDRSWQPFNMK